MMKSGRATWGVFAVVALLAASGPRRVSAFDAQQFSPAVDPQGYFSVYSSRTAPAGRFHLSAWYNYADDPIRIVVPGSPPFLGLPIFPSTPPTEVRIVDELHTIDLVASYSLFDWLELGVDLPISDVKSDLDGVEEATGIDNVRLLGKVQLLDNRDSIVGVALVPFVDLPSGDEDRLTSNGELNFGAIGVADTIYKRFRASVNLGFRVNDKPFDSSDESDEFLFGAGAGLLALKDHPILFGVFDNVEVLGEVFGATAEQDFFGSELVTPFEGLGGARFYGPSGFYFTAGIGKSITKSFNGAAVRLVASVGYTPPPPPPPPPPAPPPPPPPPPAEKVVVTDEQIVTLEPIYFDFDKDSIKPVSYAILDQVASVMTDRPGMVVRVEGHTDSFGSDMYNQDLSERRAHSVVRYLIGKGIQSPRLQAIGYGEGRPIATNDTSAGRAKNRRTEFHIVGQGG